MRKYEGYPENKSSVFKYCHCSVAVTMVRIRAEFVDSLALAPFSYICAVRMLRGASL